jgi:L-histidine N-alpha-methyltransferase
MSPTPQVTVDVHISDEDWLETLAAVTARGLASRPKEVSPVWFYDARGSELFDAITRLPEYYLTRAERSLLAAASSEIAEATGADTLVELGSGTSEKTRLLLDAFTEVGALRRYVPFDVSESTVRSAAVALADAYPGLEVHAVVGDFHRHLGELPDGGGRLVAFLGSTIGNLGPSQRRGFFRSLAAAMTPADRFLLGVDLVKDVDTLLAAYDDAAGITAEFNRNALHVMNRYLHADFDPLAFEHVAMWNDDEQWIEMRLRARHAHAVTIQGLATTVTFARGEDLRTEISAKFTTEGITAELRDTGFAVQRSWGGDDEFALLLASPVM